MKNLIFGAASILALNLVHAVHAQPASPTNSTVPSPSTNKPAAPTGKPTAPAPLLTPGTPPTKVIAPAPAAPLQPLTPPTAQQPKMKPQVPPHAHPSKHHAHKKHHHHGAHHPKYRIAVTEIYITFPPAQGCDLEYYWANPAYPYAYYGGYFWYPHTQANVLTGYTPSYWNGYYWYASRMHPHTLYVERQATSYVIPVNTRLKQE